MRNPGQHREKHAFRTRVPPLTVFVASAAAFHALLWLAAFCRVYPRPRWFAPYSTDLMSAYLLTFALPTAVIWATATLVDLFSPRTLVVIGASGKRAIVGWAVAVSGLSLVLIGLAALYLSPWLSDEVCVFLGSGVATAIVFLAIRRVVPGHCARCGYDITRSIDFGRCPECGTAIRTD